MAAIEQDIVDAFNASRWGAASPYLCNAPFSSMYINVMGQVAPCWLTPGGAPTWPEQSLRDIWFGEFFGRLRQNIERRDLTGHLGCTVCEKNLRTGNYMQALAWAYDTGHPPVPYPTMMEIELSNQCNLECVMCRGELSSMIRKNRDKLPPLEMRFDARFVEELCEFLPHLRFMRCNGGEPFLQAICFDIWNRIAEINPEIEVTVATNATALNKRVKDILERCRFRINVSIDALDKSNYETIRKNARYDVVMRNVRYFGDYCRTNGRIFSIMINPMRQNWWEMADMVRWCNANDYHLSFNTVVKPAHSSLITWDAGNLERAYAFLSRQEFDDPAASGHSEIREGNTKKYRNFVENQLRPWWLNAKQGGKFFAADYMDDRGV